MIGLLSDLLFTPLCLGCKKLGVNLCSACLDQLEIVNRTDLPGIDRLFCAGEYQHWLREQVIAYKSGSYQNARGLAQVLIFKCLDKLPSYPLVPIPSSEEKIKIRGIDTIGHLTKQIRFFSPSVQVLPALRLTKNLPDQVGLSKQERIGNLKDAFACMKPISKPVILIDDVVTTGATLISAAQTLLKHGAPEVYAVGLCATQKLR